MDISSMYLMIILQHIISNLILSVVIYFCFYLQKDMSFIFATRVEDVLNAAFDGGFPDFSAATTSKL